jgi:glycine cleavage system H lipoate-binding protein
MRCPYLREAQIKFCRASPFKKMILRTPSEGEQERCVSPDWISCGIAKQHSEDQPSQSHCPFLHEMLAQYCSISPVRTFVPYSDSPISRCSNESHKYCEAFLSLSNAATHSGTGEGFQQSVEGIPMPGRLAYAQNHMWIDNDDSVCHVGIDAFLAWAIGKVDRIAFPTSQGKSRPIAVLTVGGVDLRMVFRNIIDVTGINMYLRSHPEKITSEPYSLGWLFEGVCRKHPGEGSDIDSGLLRGKNAREWMSREIERMTTFVHDRLAETCLMADGGTFARGFLRELNCDAALRVYNEFFSLEAVGRVTP